MKSSTATSVSPNWLPTDPSSVRVEVIRIQVVRPSGSATVCSRPGFSTRTAVLPRSVVTSSHFTAGPSAPGLVLNRSSPASRGRSRSSCSHWPTADSRPLLCQPVVGSPSTVAAGPLPTEVPPSWVASDAELDTLIRAPSHSACTRSVSGTG